MPSSPAEVDKTTDEPESVAGLDFDVVLKRLGERGRYQVFIYYLLCIPATLPAAWLAFIQVFVSAIPDHWCSVPDVQDANLTLSHRKNLTVPRDLRHGKVLYEKCFMYDVNYTEFLVSGNWPMDANPSWPKVPCRHGWEYDKTDYDRTLVTDLNVVCDDEWWITTASTFFYVGSLVGNLIFGRIADKLGRRTAFFIIVGCQVTLSTLTAFSSSYLMYTVLRTIVGLTFPADFQIPFILAMEMMGPSARTYAGMVICIFFAAAMAFLAVLSYLLRDWFKLTLITSAPFFLLFAYWWVIPESPRWLLTQNRIDDAEEVVQKMARINKVAIPKDYLRSVARHTKRPPVAGAVETVRNPAIPIDSPMALVRGYPNIRKKFVIITIAWLSNAVVYNGLSYNSSNLGVSGALAFFIGAAVEIPSYIVHWYAMDRFGRRWVLSVTMIIGGISCLLCMFVPEAFIWTVVSLAMITKFCIAGSFAVIYVFAGELLPTVVRSSAMGIASFVAGIGLLTFPFIVELNRHHRVLPLLVFGALSLIGGVLAVFLPETLYAHLPQTLEEGEEFGKTFEMWSLPSRETRREVERRSSHPQVHFKYLESQDACTSRTNSAVSFTPAAARTNPRDSPNANSTA